MYMWEVLYNKHIVSSAKRPDGFNVFDGGVKAANNNIVAFVIDGTKCSVFLPNVLSNEQLNSLVDLIYLMNDKQNSNSIYNFEMHIYHNKNIYDDVNDDNINLRSFVEFLIKFGLCDDKDFDFKEPQEQLHKRS